MRYRALVLSEFASSSAAWPREVSEYACAKHFCTTPFQAIAYCGEASNLVPKPFGLDYCNLL